MTPDAFWAAAPPDWDRVVKACRKAGLFGLDTEFYGANPKVESTVGRSRVHIWSVAVPHGGLHPRGFRLCHSAVLPVEALEYGPILDLLGDPRVTKSVHNQPVDDHSMANHGVALRGVVNTLALARWAWPERHPGDGGPGWSLDALGRDLMGEGKADDYEEIVREEFVETVVKYRKEQRCECGTRPCRKKKSTPGHTRVVDLVPQVGERPGVRQIGLATITPEHPRWARLLAYAARDPALALGVYDLARAVRRDVETPW